MTPEELIKLIPEVLLYVIPGFLVLKITEEYYPTKKHEQFETILWSILLSFVVEIEYDLLRSIYKFLFRIFPLVITISEAKKLVICFLLSILTGYVLIKAPKSGLGVKVTKYFNPNLGPDEDLWFVALQSKNGVWATVYLKDGLAYTGMLSKFTADSDEKDKLILLKKYRLMIRNESPGNNNGTTSSFLRTVADHSSDDSAQVLLRYEDIIAIEMCD